MTLEKIILPIIFGNLKPSDGLKIGEFYAYPSALLDENFTLIRDRFNNAIDEILVIKNDISEVSNNLNNIDLFIKVNELTQDFINNFGDNKTTIFVKHILNVKSNVLVSNNIVFVFLNGGGLNIDNNVIVNFKSNIIAGIYKIFYGNGNVVFNSIDYVYPQWWGAIMDGETDDSIAWQKSFYAYNVVKASGRTKANITLPSYSSLICDYLKIYGTLSCIGSYFSKTLGHLQIIPPQGQIAFKWENTRFCYFESIGIGDYNKDTGKYIDADGFLVTGYMGGGTYYNHVGFLEIRYLSGDNYGNAFIMKTISPCGPTGMFRVGSNTFQTVFIQKCKHALTWYGVRNNIINHLNIEGCTGKIIYIAPAYVDGFTIVCAGNKFHGLYLENPSSDYNFTSAMGMSILANNFDSETSLPITNLTGFLFHGRKEVASAGYKNYGYYDKYVSGDSYPRCRITGTSINFGDGSSALPSDGITRFQDKLVGTSGDLVSFKVGSGRWNEGILQMGSVYIWFDYTNRALRIKRNSRPTSETDGTVIVTVP